MWSFERFNKKFLFWGSIYLKIWWEWKISWSQKSTFFIFRTLNLNFFWLKHLESSCILKIWTLGNVVKNPSTRKTYNFRLKFAWNFTTIFTPPGKQNCHPLDAFSRASFVFWWCQTLCGSKSNGIPITLAKGTLVKHKLNPQPGH